MKSMIHKFVRTLPAYFNLNQFAMQTHILVFSTVLLALFQTACKKDKDFADPGIYTQKYDSLGLPIIEPQYPNKAAYGCMINGQLWIPEGGNWLEGPFSCDVFARTEPDSIAGGELNASLNKGSIDQLLHITLPTDCFRPGEFGLADWQPGIGQFGFDAYFTDYGPGPSYISALRDSLNSKLNITHFDFEKSYIAGTFRMTMYKINVSGSIAALPFAERDQYLDFSDSIVITNGRFGMKYRPN